MRWPAASNVSANSTSNSSPMRPRSGIVSRRSDGTRMRRWLRRLQRRRRADDLAVSGGEAIEWFRRDSERGDEAWPAASSYEPERRKIGPRGPDDRRCRRRTLRGRSGRRSILPRAVSRESKTRSETQSQVVVDMLRRDRDQLAQFATTRARQQARSTRTRSMPSSPREMWPSSPLSRTRNGRRCFRTRRAPGPPTSAH